MISISLMAAAIITVEVGILHSWIGERRLIGPLLTDNGGQHGVLANGTYARTVLRFAWHLTSVAWCGFGAILAVLAWSPFEGREVAILLIVILTFLLTGLIALVVSRGRHLAGPIFLIIAGLSAGSLLSLTVMH